LRDKPDDDFPECYFFLYPEGHTGLKAVTFLVSFPLTQVIVINFGFVDFVGVGDLEGVGVASTLKSYSPSKLK
jgi:hypothetical protein